MYTTTTTNTLTPSSVCIERLKAQKFLDYVGSTNEFISQYFNPDQDDTQSLSQRATQTSNEIISIRNLDLYSSMQNMEHLSLNANKAMPAETRAKKRSSAPTKKVHLHDPTINNVFLSLSTLKYAIIALITLCLLGSFLFLFVIGVLYISDCADDPNIPVYLLVLGGAGLIRVFLFYACPFSYSDSTITKMYEHLVWRLVINRFRSSYHNILAIKSSHNDDYTSYSCLAKAGVRLKGVCSFLVSFLCCNCCCFAYFNQLFDVHNKKSIFVKRPKEQHQQQKVKQHSILKSQANTDVFQMATDQSSVSLSTQFYLSNNSTTNMSEITRPSTAPTTFSSIIGEFNCLNVPNFANMIKYETEDSSSARNSSSRSSIKSRVRKTFRFKSYSMSELEPVRADDQPKLKRTASFSSYKKSNSSSSHFEKSQNVLGNRLFYGKYGNKYGTHKRLYRHHNKTQRPFRLVDFRTVRYCVAYLLQRCLDVFIVCWFVCGNYWVFNVTLSDTPSDGTNANASNSTSRLETSGYLSGKYNFKARKLISIKEDDASPAKARNTSNTKIKSIILNVTFIDSLIPKSIQAKNLTYVNYNTTIYLNNICYQTAFVQIVSTYSLLALIVVCVISYRFYMAVCDDGRGPARKGRARHQHKHQHQHHQSRARAHDSKSHRQMHETLHRAHSFKFKPNF